MNIYIYIYIYIYMCPYIYIYIYIYICIYQQSVTLTRCASRLLGHCQGVACRLRKKYAARIQISSSTPGENNNHIFDLDCPLVWNQGQEGTIKDVEGQWRTIRYTMIACIYNLMIVCSVIVPSCPSIATNRPLLCVVLSLDWPSIVSYGAFLFLNCLFIVNHSPLLSLIVLWLSPLSLDYPWLPATSALSALHLFSLSLIVPVCLSWPMSSAIVAWLCFGCSSIGP